jgi:hypothetical protein
MVWALNQFIMKITERLIEGLELIYKGKAFKGFKEDDPFVTFLGYDSLGWTNIWVKYKGRLVFTSVFDVDVAR